jgi:hypothetical protein
MRVSVLFVVAFSLALVLVATCTPLQVSAGGGGHAFGKGHGSGLPGGVTFNGGQKEAVKEKVEELRARHGNINGDGNGNGNGNGNTPTTTRPPPTTTASTTTTTTDACAPVPGQCTAHFATWNPIPNPSNPFDTNLFWFMPIPVFDASGNFIGQDTLLNMIRPAFGLVPQAWLNDDCTGTKQDFGVFVELSDFVSNLGVNPSWSLTIYCNKFLPCLYCYDLPEVPADPNGNEAAVTLPEDGILQSQFSLGWWYVAATLRPLIPTPNVFYDVCMCIYYFPVPKYIQQVIGGWGGGVMPKVSEGMLSIQSTNNGHSQVRDSTGITTNQFDGTRQSPTFHPKYVGPTLGLDIELVGGALGTKGARYSITGSSPSGGSINLIGKAVSELQLQGGRGYQTSPYDTDGLSDVTSLGRTGTPYAGTNYFSIRLDVTGSITEGTTVSQVAGEADFDMQWGHGNPNPLNPTHGWIWYNFRLPGQCTVFINVFHDATQSAPIYHPLSKPYTILQSNTLISAEGPIKQKYLQPAIITTTKTWTSSKTATRYPVETTVEIPGWGTFATKYRFIDSEITASTGTPGNPVEDMFAIWEGSIDIIPITVTPEYTRDCSGPLNEVGANQGWGEYTYYGSTLGTTAIPAVNEV